MKKHKWLKLSSKRTQPYTIEDISVIIPSAAHRYKNRWEWFWPQYVEKTHPKVVENTWIPCDEAEYDFLSKLTGSFKVFQCEPRWIVYKTLFALDKITSRLTFRLANDIMVVRKGWEKLLLDQFNAQERLQIIAEAQHGQALPEDWERLTENWEFIRKEYPKQTTAAVYPHGSRIFAQTAVWNAYYRQVLRCTPHDGDELYFSQIARGDGTVFTNFRGINLYLAHVGEPQKDFKPEDVKRIEQRRKELADAPDKHEFTVMQ